MATTTNFGWETPDDTDLVKDGALAMRTLGNAIDASLVDLKGGTTGQVLSKASNTDLDYTWVTQDDANAIQNAIVDAKGDLIAASAADTPARLAVGNNGETLVADSSASTGLRWTATPSASNPVLNSSYDIWQRGTSIASGAAAPYTADRWQIGRSGSVAGITVSRQATGDSTNLPNIQYAARVQRDSGNTSTAQIYFMQSFETANSIPFAGKTVTLSFYARSGSNFSAASSLMFARIDTGTGTDQNVFTGYAGSATPVNESKTITTTWQRFSVTASLASTTTELGLLFGFTPVGTAGAADYFEITGVQLDIGSVALPYRRNSATLAGELAACRRYLPAYTYGTSLFGYAYQTNGSVGYIAFDTPARVNPTGITIPTLSGNFLAYNKTNGSSVPSSVTLNFAGLNGGSILWGSTATAGDPTRLEISGGTGYILFTGCEL